MASSSSSHVAEKMAESITTFNRVFNGGGQSETEEEAGYTLKGTGWIECPKDTSNKAGRFVFGKGFERFLFYYL